MPFVCLAVFFREDRAMRLTFFGAAIVLSGLIPRVPPSKGPIWKCKSNLHHIAIALREYEETNGTLPPLCLCDEQGRPMHSWRVLLLPYLDEHELYRDYDFGEAWDHPNNLRLLNRMPDVFKCPVNADQSNSKTSFLAFVGSETVWSAKSKCSILNLDVYQASISVILVSLQSVQIEWLKPQDFELDSYPTEDNRSHSRNTLQIVFADGLVSLANDPDVLHKISSKGELSSDQHSN